MGREHELAVIDAALRGGEDRASIVFVHGPGGVGKSMLLAQVAAHAAQAGRRVVEVDGRTAGRSTDAFEAAAEPVTTGGRVALIVDTFEQCHGLETWLRDRFLARVPADAVVVVAGREPPDPQWSVDPGWSSVVEILKLGPLDRAKASELVASSGLSVAAQNAVLRFAGGNPLVLSLATAVTARTDRGPLDASWAPSSEVLPTLVSRLVGEVPTPVHRQALSVAARAFTTDEELLRSVLVEGDATELFSWLAAVPYVEAADAGLQPHDAVREALVADLRWRDTLGDDDLRRRLRTHLAQRVRAVPEHRALAAMAELAFVDRDAPRIAHVYQWDGQGEESERMEPGPLNPEDLPAALEMVRRQEGQDSATIAEHWYTRTPEAFALYRGVDTGEPAGLTVRLVLTAPHQGDLDIDPVVAAAWRHCVRTEPPTDGQHIAVRRFTIHEGADREATALTNLASWASLAAICRSTGLAHGFVVHRDTDFWHTWLGATTDGVEEAPVVDGRTYALFVNDWRYLTFEQYWERAVEPEPSTAPAPAYPDITRDAFDEAVREALTLWRRRGGLADNRLATTGLVAPSSAGADTTLRAALRQALEAMRADHRTLRGHDAIVATYLDATTTQHAAARRLGVPFGTYRRHLRSGFQALTERLWRAAREGARQNRTRPCAMAAGRCT